MIIKNDIEIGSRTLSEVKNKRYELVSRTYKDNFAECVLIILDNKTGKVKKEVISLK